MQKIEIFITSIKYTSVLPFHNTKVPETFIKRTLLRINPYKTSFYYGYHTLIAGRHKDCKLP